MTGAVDAAVASFGGFGRKNGPDGTAGPGKKEATKIVVKEPQSHKQTTAEKRTGPQLHVRHLLVARYNSRPLIRYLVTGYDYDKITLCCTDFLQGETDPLDVAFQHSAELQQKNTELTKRLSNYETKKKQEINDLTTHLKELQRAVTVLNRDLEKKDKKIAEMKTLVQKLSDKKRDGSSELARALHEKDTKIETLTQLLQTEKGKLRVTSTEVKEKQKESEEYKKQTQELSNELKKTKCELGDAFVDITFDKDSISHSGATHDTTHTPKDKEVQELNEAIQSEPTESPGESVALEKVDQLQEALREKETQLANLENQLKEYEAKVLEMEQVRDHSKSQSKAMLVVKQELDATKVNEW